MSRKRISNEEIANRYRAGQSSRQIADEANLSVPTILTAVRAAGGTVRPQGSPRGSRTAFRLSDVLFAWEAGVISEWQAAKLLKMDRLELRDRRLIRIETLTKRYAWQLSPLREQEETP